jgi:hypothetical protein
MRVIIVDIKMDENGEWQYKVKDKNDELVDDGKFFPEDDLSNNED